jgi:starch synthase
MNVIYLSSEVTPFSKTGGLADVSGTLPKDLKTEGVNITVFAPKQNIDKKKHNLKLVLRKVRLKLGKKTKEANLYQGFLPNSDVPIYFLDKELYFNRPGLYGENGTDYPDNAQRFSFFCQAVLECLKILDLKPDIIHCNDWQTALAAIYLKNNLAKDPFYAKTKTLFTIHNLAYQGLFPKEILPQISLSEKLYTPEKIEFWKKISLLKGGLVYSDLINTVSPTYSKEIQTKNFGCGLDALLSARSKDLHGILNGLDYQTWNTSVDPELAQNYTPDSLNLKEPNKQQLLAHNGLAYQKDIPVVSIISRLVPQKGWDTLLKILPEMLQMDIKFILLGEGLPKYEEALKKLASQFPGKIKVNIGYDEKLAKKIYAGSDMFLIPSEFEPCGLGQLISLKYGTVPLATKTGGLADSIIDIDHNYEKGNGYLAPNASEYLNTFKRALHCYHNDKIKWIQAQRNGMFADFSWHKSAKEYKKLYEKLLS